jgi:Sap, sulfolipid-1-addressing protein
MWLTVLLMAVVAGLDPVRIAAVVVILSKKRPVAHLVAYLIGGFLVSLIVGAVIVFVLEGVGVGSGSGIPAEIEIAVGALALIVAVLVSTGIADKLRSKARQQPVASVGADAATKTASTQAPRRIDELAAFQKLPAPLQKALKTESVWVAWVAGVAIGMPSAYYLAAIAAILNMECSELAKCATG